MSAFVTFMPGAPAPGNALTPSRRSRAPSPFLILHPSPVALLLETCLVAAPMSITPCFNPAHHRHNVRHQCGAFSRLHTPSISVGACLTHVHEIHDVHKCTPLYCQLPSSSVCSLLEPRRKWLDVAHSNAPRRWPFFIPHPSSLPVWETTGM